MIEELHIKDFQKHKDLKLSFTKGLNVIIGHTDAGKSAIFRALNFCLYNEHKGVNHVRLGTKFSDVTCTIHGKKIRRVKGNSKNFYEVDGLELKAFGAKLPEEVQQVTRMGDINIQGQHDNIFLLADSPGAVARYLNKLINIDIIDRTMSALGAAQLAASREVSTNESELVIVAEEISKVKYIKKCRKKFDSIKNQFKCQEDAEAELRAVERCVAELNSIKPTIDLAPMKAAIAEMESIIVESEKLIKKGQEVVYLVTSFPEVPNVDCRAFREIEEKFDANTKKAVELRRVRNQINEYQELEKVLNSNAEYLLEIKKELEEACKVCPTCGKDWQ